MLTEDPEFSSRDAVYYHLAEALLKQGKNAEALPYFERVLKEFEQSSYLEASRRRVDELKGALGTPR